MTSHPFTGCRSTQAQDGLSGVSADALADNILARLDVDKDGSITQEEYLVWAVDQSLPSDFLTLLIQVMLVFAG